MFEMLIDIGREVCSLHALESDLHYHARCYKSRQSCVQLIESVSVDEKARI